MIHIQNPQTRNTPCSPPTQSTAPPAALPPHHDHSPQLQLVVGPLVLEPLDEGLPSIALAQHGGHLRLQCSALGGLLVDGPQGPGVGEEGAAWGHEGERMIMIMIMIIYQCT